MREDSLDDTAELLPALPLLCHLRIHAPSEPALDGGVVELVELGDATVDFGFRVEDEGVNREDEEGGVDGRGREGGEFCELGEGEGATGEEDGGGFLRGKGGKGSATRERNGGGALRGEQVADSSASSG